MVRSSSALPRTSIVLLLAALLVLGTVPGVAVAETRSGGTIVVGTDETIEEDLQAFGGRSWFAGR